MEKAIVLHRTKGLRFLQQQLLEEALDFFMKEMVEGQRRYKQWIARYHSSQIPENDFYDIQKQSLFMLYRVLIYQLHDDVSILLFDRNALIAKDQIWMLQLVLQYYMRFELNMYSFKVAVQERIAAWFLNQLKQMTVAVSETKGLRFLYDEAYMQSREEFLAEEQEHFL